MSIGVRITWRGLESTPTIEDLVERKVRKLIDRHPDLQDVHVVIEAPTARHRYGGEFHVRMEAMLPGNQVVVLRDGQLARRFPSLPPAVNHAFRVANRQLASRMGRLQAA